MKDEDPLEDVDNIVPFDIKLMRNILGMSICFAIDGDDARDMGSQLNADVNHPRDVDRKASDVHGGSRCSRHGVRKWEYVDPPVLRPFIKASRNSNKAHGHVSECSASRYSQPTTGAQNRYTAEI